MKILFVCTGNICRSPTAEGVFQRMVDQFGLSEIVEVDSAGTQDYHVGAAPDRRAQQAALKRGVDLSRLRAREVERSCNGVGTGIILHDGSAKCYHTAIT